MFALYSFLKVSKENVTSSETIQVSVKVKNIGKVDGEEVVQMYVHDVKSSVERPSKELRGFERIALKVGEEKTVTMELPTNSLAFYDETIHDFFTEAGEYQIMVGAASDDIRLTKSIVLK